MKFGAGQKISIVAYSIMFVIGIAINSYSLVGLLRARFFYKDRSRMSLLLIHLSVADLLVIFLRKKKYQTQIFREKY